MLPLPQPSPLHVSTPHHASPSAGWLSTSAENPGLLSSPSPPHSAPLSLPRTLWAPDHLFMLWRKKDIAEILKESLLQARDTLKRNLPELRKIADDIDEVHRGATIANITGGTVGIAGGITTIVGLALAPVTFGASLIVSLTGLGVSTLGGLTSAAATATDLGVNKVKKETVEKLLEECRSELVNINQCIKIIQVSAQSMKDDGSGDLLFGVSQIGSGAGRVVLNTMKMVKAGQLLANAGRVARFAGSATHVLTALTLGLDIFFVAKDSRELYNGAKTELAANIRDAVKEMEQVYDQKLSSKLKSPRVDSRWSQWTAGVATGWCDQRPVAELADPDSVCGQQV
uniref:Apolipoprotein L3 n=1 Tax=Pelusios castaneus TaxID=367368 RepID=A0A8C8VKL4_9SAUR